MGILRTDRVSGLGGANAITGSVSFETGRNKPIFLKIASDDFAVGTGDFTLECWYYKSGLGTHDDAVGNIIMETGNQNGQNGIWLADAQGKLEGRVHYGSGSWNLDITSSSSMVNDRWYHVAMSRSGSTVRIFIDGTLEASGSSSSDLTTAYSNEAYVGAQGNSTGNRGIIGFVSNARISNTALYTAAFTVPTTRLEKLSSTLLLCCQSPGNVLQEATGKEIQTYVDSTNNQGPQASRFTPNSPVGFSTTTDVGSQYGATFDGFGSFATSTYMVPPGGNTRERNRGRGLIMGGAVSPGATNTTQIKYFDIAAGGITEDFGQTTVARRSTGSFSSSTRALMGGGFVAPTSPHTISDVIDFVTIANTANAIDFGNMQSTGYAYGTASNETRGLFAGGYRPNNGAVVNTIDLITIATAGNASNFGDLTRQVRSFGGFSSSTRGVFAGGTYPAVQDVIDFVTFSTTGDATDFGNLTDARDNVYGSSSSTRGVIAGGRDPNTTNIIDFITIATAGNAIDFGDLSQTSYYYNAATSNSTKAVWIGNGSITNAAEFVTIATTGNATDFGDQNGTAQHSNGACSDSHGGL